MYLLLLEYIVIRNIVISHSFGFLYFSFNLSIEKNAFLSSEHLSIDTPTAVLFAYNYTCIPGALNRIEVFFINA